MNRWARAIAFIKQRETPVVLGVFAVLLVCRIWLIAGIPKLLVDGPYDDSFYAKAAHFIVNGQWMGPYDNLTLMKGPFYAFFLIPSAWSGLPLFINETLFYLAACVLFYFAISPLIKNRWARLFMFALLAFYPPGLASWWNLRVYRDYVYFSLNLYIAVCAAGLFLRIGTKLSRLLPWSIGLGLSMGAFMLTREEGIWIYPMLFLLLAACIALVWVRKMEQKWRRQVLVLLPVLLWIIPTLLVSALNYSHYGFWGAAEIVDPDFSRVMNTLGRIKSSTWYPQIQITAQARKYAYRASPLFKELKDAIEGAVLDWQIHDDIIFNTTKPAWFVQAYNDGSAEIGNGHLFWIIRDAVFYYSKKHGLPGTFPKEVFRQLADQLEAACSSGKLDCRPGGTIPLVGSIDARHVPIIARIFVEGFYRVLVFDRSLSYLSFNLDFNSWIKYTPETNYYQEFTHDPFVIQGAGAEKVTQGPGVPAPEGLRLKQGVMESITSVYRFLGLPAFLTGFLGWLLVLILSIIKRRWLVSESYLVVPLFTLGLFISRLMTLSIIDATTSVPGIVSYGASIFIFMILFDFVTIACTVQSLREYYSPA